jgi:hypothetical protein
MYKKMGKSPNSGGLLELKKVALSGTHGVIF